MKILNSSLEKVTEPALTGSVVLDLFFKIEIVSAIGNGFVHDL